VAELVHDAEPRFVQYRNLKVAYARYRELAADSALPTIRVSKAVHPGEAFPGVDRLRRRLAALGDLSAESGSPRAAGNDVYDGAVAAGVARFQERHGLIADSVLGPGTAAAINVPMSRRLRQLELALERIRWLPPLDAGPFVVVNVPGFQLYAFDTLGATGEPSFTMNVVVGKAEVSRQTPLFERDMEYIVFRPYWVIPPGILRREILPAMRRDPGYLARHDMEIYSGSGDRGRRSDYIRQRRSGVPGELGIRRRPGPQNDLGLAKFIFPNDHNVYMHGTPATALFPRAARLQPRLHSVEDPARFAVWTLRDPNKWSLEQVQSVMNGSRSERVDLARPIPVTVLYTTAVASGRWCRFTTTCTVTTRDWSVCFEKGYPFAPENRESEGNRDDETLGMSLSNREASRGSSLPTRLPLPVPALSSPPLYTENDWDPIRIRVVGEGGEVARFDEERRAADGETESRAAVEAELRLRVRLIRTWGRGHRFSGQRLERRLDHLRSSK
jgi:murein L,D-transpeptidase YcbB/YkuD